ncbi:hypothetical protein [Micropruina sp.]|uniref:hypothetical protein n=1 Tax=Micropruina sp. TaxID=2737536 RepID=UPI0039E4D488
MNRLRGPAVLVVCLALVAVLNGFRETGIAQTRSYLAGADGWAHAPSASGFVHRARLARGLLRPTIEEPLLTDAVFVVIELEVQVRDRALPLSTLTLETTDGYRYSQLTDAGLAGLSLTQPGWTSYGTAVFEVPPQRVPGARLVVGAQSDMLVIYRAQLAFDAVVSDFTVHDRVAITPARSEVTR